jgi:hypothetical protein
MTSVWRGCELQFQAEWPFTQPAGSHISLNATEAWAALGSMLAPVCVAPLPLTVISRGCRMSRADCPAGEPGAAGFGIQPSNGLRHSATHEGSNLNCLQSNHEERSLWERNRFILNQEIAAY